MEPTRAAGIRYIERITGGASAAEKLPMVVAIHGLGDRPDHFAHIFDGFPARARFIFPYGEPYGDGFSWFPIQKKLDMDAIAVGTERTAHRLAAMIASLVASRPTAGKPIVTGFSQGGMMSFTLAVLHPEIIGEAFPLSGFLAPRLVPASWPLGKVVPPILALHGDTDQVIPIQLARDTIAGLKPLGFRAELREYPGVGHTVSSEMQRVLFGEIEGALRRAVSP